MHFYPRKIVKGNIKTIALMLFLFLFTVSFSSWSQEKKRVEILQADSLTQSDNIANALRLLNNVIIKHKEILMYCDSAYTYEGSNRVDAFGHVHINQGDTLHLYANKVYYDGDRSHARAINNVRLKNTSTVLYTDTLDYDMENNIGYYDCFGKIVDSTTTLTSKVGEYYLDTDMVDFRDSVRGHNEKYNLFSDNIKYNTTTEIIYFGGPTTVKDSLNTMYAEDGWYNTISGEAELTLRPQVYDSTRFMTADYIKYNKISGDGSATGSAHMEDYSSRTIVEANKVIFNEITEIASATDSAVFIAYNNTDSLYMHADTLRTSPDTVEGANIVQAFYGVRFFRSDLQGLCDSLIYFSKDSLVELHHDPVIWSNNQQMSASYINMKQRSNAPDEIYLEDNCFIISKLDSGRYDQIKGKKMNGYVINGKLTDIDVDGNGQTLYYARDKEAIIGLNRAESSRIAIKFKDDAIHKISFLRQPSGDMKPLLELTEGDKTLSGFEWKIYLRPLAKEDIFRKPGKKEEEEKEKLVE